MHPLLRACKPKCVVGRWASAAGRFQNLSGFAGRCTYLQPSMAAAATSPANPFGMEEEAAALKEFAEIPVVSKVLARKAASNGVQLTVHVNQRNLAANNQRKFSIPVVIPDAADPAAGPFVGAPTEIAPSALSSLSPSGRYSFVVKSGSGEGKAEGSTLEVWNSSRLVLELVVPATVHGGVLNDGWFGNGGRWSPAEDQIVYVAEAPAKDATPTWGGDASIPKDAPGPKTFKGQGKWQEDWGELYANKRPPCLFVLDIAGKTVTRVAPHDDDFSTSSFGQPVWTPDGKGLVAVVWPHLPVNFPGVAKRLGVVYCANRPCYLVHIDADGSAESKPASPLIPGQQAACCPTFTPDGKRLLFLSHEAAVKTGAHLATSALYSLPWPLEETPTASPIIPVIGTPASPTAFPGLYTMGIPSAPFLDDDTLLLNTQWRSQTAVIKVTLSTGEVTPVTPLGPNAGSWAFHATAGGVVVATHASPSQPPTVMVAKADLASSTPWTWQPLPGLQEHWSTSDSALQTLSDINVDVLTITPTVGPLIAFEAITLYPKHAAGPVPTIIAPHGGPHTAFPTTFFMPYAILLRAGYGMVLINYRGSTGFGEDSLQSLPGNIGTNDVADCIAALDAAVQAGLADPAHIALIGGSHGGFLTGHLIGQHPDRFTAAVMRNPVCNLSLMTGTTDILDWIYVEAYGPEEGHKRFNGPVPTPEDLQHFYNMSPVAHVHKVKTPVALMLGAKDLRVPLADGKQYAAALQSRGIPTHVVVFPDDTHGLDKPQTEFEQWLTSLWWLKQHGMP